MKNTPLYRLEVAPLVILPLSRSPYFSYSSPLPVQKGSLVSISFGKQTIEGVVFDCQELPGPRPSWMKPLSRVVKDAFLSEEQCTLAQAISDEYFTPLGKTLRHFLPNIVEARKQVSEEETSKKTLLRPTKEEQALLKKFSLLKRDRPAYIDTSLLADQKRIYLLIAKACQKEKKQLLIIVPEITLIPALAARFQKDNGSKNLVVLHSKLSHGAYFAAWERIRSGQARVIIATRQGLFAPFHDLGTIIVTEEQDESYKQWDMSPRYHGKRDAALLSTLSGAKLLLASPTPSTESVLAIREKRYAVLRVIPDHPPLGSALTIVNLKLERYRKNFSPLSEALVQELRETTGRGDQALLYINRQGMNAFSVCEHCKNVFRCKECDHPLTSTKEGHFRCLSCGYMTSLFPNCPGCGHLVFRHVGFGTERVEKEVAKLFPRARIARLDSTTLRTGKTAEALYKKGTAEEIDILIGTQMALKDPPLPRLTLVAMIDADSLLLFPDFQADERLFQSLSRAVRQVAHGEGRRGRPGKVLIQTFRPESAFFQKAVTVGSAAFFEQTLSERQELSYPPFSRFLSLTCQGKTEKEATEKSARLFSSLKEALPREYRLHPPHPVRLLKKRKLFESALLIRFPSVSKLPDKLRKFLVDKSKDCIIDVDPLTPR